MTGQESDPALFGIGELKQRIGQRGLIDEAKLFGAPLIINNNQAFCANI